MRRLRKTSTVLGALAVAALMGACASDKPIDPPLPPPPMEPGLSPRAEAIYQTCLDENRAVAMAWSAIEANCRLKAEAAAGGKPSG